MPEESTDQVLPLRPTWEVTVCLPTDQASKSLFDLGSDPLLDNLCEKLSKRYLVDKSDGLTVIRWEVLALSDAVPQAKVALLKSLSEGVSWHLEEWKGSGFCDVYIREVGDNFPRTLADYLREADQPSPGLPTIEESVASQGLAMVYEGDVLRLSGPPALLLVVGRTNERTGLASVQEVNDAGQTLGAAHQRHIPTLLSSGRVVEVRRVDGNWWKLHNPFSGESWWTRSECKPRAPMLCSVIEGPVSRPGAE